ncbi:MAG: hypothetical protein AMS25_01950 [Gemmatimonas sp. SM23_52]|nr:MAG: hypothetical protein AMS25_01950 [Gemmatimonas sp. SM23_52]
MRAFGVAAKVEVGFAAQAASDLSASEQLPAHNKQGAICEGRNDVREDAGSGQRVQVERADEVTVSVEDRDSVVPEVVGQQRVLGERPQA